MKKRTTFSVVPWYFTIPSLIGLALILGPLLGLLYNIPWMGLREIIDEEVVGATQLSLVTASISTLICGVLVPRWRSHSAKYLTAPACAAPGACSTPLSTRPLFSLPLFRAWGCFSSGAAKAS